MSSKREISEPARRAMLAVLMLVLLAGSVGAAWLVVRARHYDPQVAADILADIFAMAGRSAVVRLALVALDQPEILLAQLGKARALLDQLERLYLGWGLLGDEHVAALAELLGRCPRLREVDVGGNYLGELGVAALREALGSGVRVNGLADQKADRGRADRQIPIFGRYGIAEDHYDTWDDAD